jgi:UDP-3-O-[3-hydroxymyristoyl] N-acetylglucosamine deacetylase
LRLLLDNPYAWEIVTFDENQVVPITYIEPIVAA